MPAKPPVWRRALLALLILIALGAAFWYIIITRRAAEPDVVAQATDVRSEVSQEGDSLEVAVDWRLTAASSASVPESVRVEVGLSDAELGSVATLPSDRRRDTLRIPTPPPGQAVNGYSCVSAIHRSRLMRESCTPWQFVLPSAEEGPAAGDTTAQRQPSRRDTSSGSASRVLRIVVQPSGLQVDPDMEGRCAEWQRENPSRSVWVDVNQRAVPDCTGPNGKPTVAQFCAFAVLADGRRIQTQNSRNSYCARLFKEWSSERVS